jgi:hypothetical protein
MIRSGKVPTKMASGIKPTSEPILPRSNSMLPLKIRTCLEGHSPTSQAVGALDTRGGNPIWRSRYGRAGR